MQEIEWKEDGEWNSAAIGLVIIDEQPFLLGA